VEVPDFPVGNDLTGLTGLTGFTGLESSIIPISTGTAEEFLTGLQDSQDLQDWDLIRVIRVIRSWLFRLRISFRDYRAFRSWLLRFPRRGSSGFSGGE
jgi:hypothetical protein